MLLSSILGFASRFFWLLLLGGWLLHATAGKGSVQRGIAWTLLGLGAFGAISGVPYWFYTGKHALETSRHFKARCAAARTELPATPRAAPGIVVVTSGDTARILRFHPDRLVAPAQGFYESVQVHRAAGRAAYDEMTSQEGIEPGRLDIKRAVVNEATLPFELRLANMTTSEDRRYDVEAAEYTMVDRATGEVFARKVLFWRVAQGNGRLPATVWSCPSDEPVQCDELDYCAPVAAFALAAVHPAPAARPEALYHLYRGMPPGRRLVRACDPVTVGPGIRLEDIEWQAQARESLILRVRGEPGELLCFDFFFAGRGGEKEIRFNDRSRYSTRELEKLWRQQQSQRPMPLPRASAARPS